MFIFHCGKASRENRNNFATQTYKFQPCVVELNGVDNRLDKVVFSKKTRIR